MIKDGKMFDIRLLDKFRDNSFSDPGQIDAEVKDAWISFISDFCQCVSYQWAEYLKQVRKKENATFQGTLTTSDEAFTMWLLKVKYDDAAREAEEIKEHGANHWKKNKKRRKSGPHDSKEKLEEFVQLHYKIRDQRQNEESNKMWEKIFYDGILSDDNILNSRTPKKHSNSLVSGCSVSIPIDDEPLLDND